MLKIRRPLGRLIFNMGIAIPGKTVFLIETAPCIWHTSPQMCHWVNKVNIGAANYYFKHYTKTNWIWHVFFLSMNIAVINFSDLNLILACQLLQFGNDEIDTNTLKSLHATHGYLGRTWLLCHSLISIIWSFKSKMILDPINHSIIIIIFLIFILALKKSLT